MVPAIGGGAWVAYLDPPTLQRLKAAAALHGESLQAFGDEAVDLLLERYPIR